MRILSDTEKDLCRRILKGKNGYNVIPNIIDDKLQQVLISIDKSSNKVEIIFPVRSIQLKNEDTQTIIERINDVSLLIVTICNLIALLEKEGYIMTVNQATEPNTKSKFGQGTGNMPNNVSHRFPDRKVNDLLVEYVDKNIIITPEFERFCKKGFIARDEQRFTRQIRLAYCAFGVALFAALVNVSSKFSNGTAIKQQQIDTLSSSLTRITVRLDTLNKNFLLYKPSQMQVIPMQKSKRKK